MIHWGEIEEEKGTDEEEEKLTFKWGSFEASAPPFSLLTSNVNKPYKRELNKRQLEYVKPPLDSRGQSHLMQSIELQHYKRRMRYMLAAARAHQADSQQKLSGENAVLPSPPLPPKRFCSNEGRLVSSLSPSFLSKEYTATDGKQGSSSEKTMANCPPLTTNSARQLLMKSVASISAHSGFELGAESSLNTLTDVTGEHLTKLCTMIKRKLENSPKLSNSVDLLNDVLEESMFESLASLHTYWLQSVKNVAVALEQTDFTLLEDYNAYKENSDKLPLNIKEEGN